jgi:transporter family-2 protein
MLYFIVVWIGVLISMMVAFNGALGLYMSAFEVSLVVHVIGLILLLSIIIYKKEKVVLFGLPTALYFTGVLGAFLTAIDAYVVGAIGVTLAVTLSTTAQIIGSAAVDAIGFGALKKVPFNAKRIGSIALLSAGVLIMFYAQWKGL